MAAELTDFLPGFLQPGDAQKEATNAEPEPAAAPAVAPAAPAPPAPQQQPAQPAPQQQGPPEPQQKPDPNDWFLSSSPFFDVERFQPRGYVRATHVEDVTITTPFFSSRPEPLQWDGRYEKVENVTIKKLKDLASSLYPDGWMLADVKVETKPMIDDKLPGLLICQASATVLYERRDRRDRDDRGKGGPQGQQGQQQGQQGGPRPDRPDRPPRDFPPRRDGPPGFAPQAPAPQAPAPQAPAPQAPAPQAPAPQAPAPPAPAPPAPAPPAPAPPAPAPQAPAPEGLAFPPLMDLEIPTGGTKRVVSARRHRQRKNRTRKQNK